MNNTPDNPSLPPTDLRVAAQQAAYFRDRRRKVALISVVILVAIFAFVTNIASMFPNSGLSTTAMAAPFVALLFIVAVYIVMVNFKPKATNPIHQLWDSKDHTIVGALIDAKEMLVPKVTVPATQALVNMLPKLEPEDAQYLNVYHRKCLRRYASPTEMEILLVRGSITKSELKMLELNRQTAVAVLKAWQTIGNSQDLLIVENLVAGKSLAKGNPEVLQAALECLPILKALVEQQKPSETYLRASSEPENLLIPAGAPDETDTELLLRPSDNPNHPSG